MLGVKVGPIELGEALLEKQSVLETVAVMFLEMAVVEGLVFFVIVKRSGTAWLVWV